MFAQIIPAKRGRLRLATLEYLVPPELESSVAIGQLVTIPLRSKDNFGVVLRLTSTPESKATLKPLKNIVFKTPLLTPSMLAFLEETGELYHTSLGFIVKNTLLPLQKRKLSKLQEPPSVDTRTKREVTKPTLFTFNNDAEKKEYIEKLLPKQGQLLILEPELIDLERLSGLLGPETMQQVAVVTSELSEKDLFTTWAAIWKGEKKIIIGTRRALFLPFTNLETIIVDNEGSDGHKSWDMAPRFHTRDAAIALARHVGAEVHLLGFSPTVETYFFAKHGTYKTVNAPSQAEHQKYSILNMASERHAGNYSQLSFPLVEALQEQTKGSVILFCHRRGAMSYVMCRDCSQVNTCQKCQTSLTYHTGGSLLCHRCGFTQAMSPTCQKCGGTNIALYGAGTEQIAKEVRQQFPHDPRPIIVIDQDSEAELPASDAIIIGTQAAWSKIPWGQVSLMAIIDADTPLFIPEYRMAERLWQLLRESRYLLPSHAELFVQTTRPEHPLFLALGNPTQFYEQQVAERKLFNYPPYKYILKLFYGAPQEAAVKAQMSQIYRDLEKLTKRLPDCTITKVFNLFPYYSKGNYWQAVLAKLPYSAYKKYTKEIVALLPETIKVDPNPNQLLSL